MIVFPNCKLNLGLHVLGKRPDGFHNLETVFYPLPIQDALEIIQHPSSNTDIEFSASGLPVDGNTTDNICVKAYHLLRQAFPDLPAVKMHLHKTIPMGAGLGGGSADGAFALMLLNKKFNLGLDEQALIRYALALGSDCPFFIKNIACYATGRGEVLEELQLDLSAYTFAIVNPGIHINTGWAFAQLKPFVERQSLKEIILLPPERWQDNLTNNFEEAVFVHHPIIQEVKEKLYKAGAVYASMTGSGSTVFGMFRKDAEPVLNFPPEYFVRMV